MPGTRALSDLVRKHYQRIGSSTAPTARGRLVEEQLSVLPGIPSCPQSGNLRATEADFEPMCAWISNDPYAPYTAVVGLMHAQADMSDQDPITTIQSQLVRPEQPANVSLNSSRSAEAS